MDILSGHPGIDKMKWYLGWYDQTWVHGFPRKILVSCNWVFNAYAM